MQAHQKEGSPQKYYILIHWWLYFLMFFFSCGNLKFWLSVFCQTNLMKWNMYYFLKIGSNKNVLNCVVFIIKFIWFNLGDTVLYPGVSLGTSVLCKGLIYLYPKTILVVHLHRQADTDIHKVFNSVILSEMIKLNVWDSRDILTLKIRLNSWCCFAPVFL